VGDRRVRNGHLSAPTGRTALFLDRDGVLNEPVWDERSGTTESPLKPSDVILTAGAASAVRRATAAGLLVIVVSNQPSAAKGIVDEPTIRAVHARVMELLAADGAVIDRSYLCLHHPQGVDARLTQACDCRKPAPGMLLKAAADLNLDLSRCWLIGDTDADLGAARRASLAGIVMIENPLSAHRRTILSDSADALTSTITSAMSLVLDRVL
jgi:D-glycero-D-manno-heptose 1,7-bisphosphate phosphatase